MTVRDALVGHDRRVLLQRDGKKLSDARCIPVLEGVAPGAPIDDHLALRVTV